MQFKPKLSCLLYVSCLIISGCTMLSVAAQTKPNILLFIADDLNQRDMGCYGNHEVKTPNIDRLASEGMRFTNAYAASPMCSPSRAALFTGLYPYKNGIQMNHFTAHAQTKSLAHFLQKQGYRVVISGKIHVGSDACFPFEHIGKEFGQYEPIENRLDRKKETVQLLQEHFRQKEQQPLCLIVAPWVPHVPWFPHKDFDPEKLTLPNDLVDTKETRGALASYYQSINEADHFFGEILQTLENTGRKDETVTMFISDQGAQFPSAKWTVYDKGIRVPLIVRWPGKVKKETVSDALVSLVDITPTLIDIAGGEKINSLDGLSFKNILRGKINKHHDYIFAETSVEPHYWYNYTPSRSVITKEGWHYIKNYHPGLRFITHIDKVERNEFYFDSWVEKAQLDSKAAFLLTRYQYRPPEELFNLSKDPDEFQNQSQNPIHRPILENMRELLAYELSRQGETEAMVLKGPLPQFNDRGYTIPQNGSVSNMSFNPVLWNPDTLYISAYLKGMNKGGILCDYFNNFKLFVYMNQVGVSTSDGREVQSEVFKANDGQLVFRLTVSGELEISINNQLCLKTTIKNNLTKITKGYVTCGKVQGTELSGKLQRFKGEISDLQFSMNELLRRPK